MRLVTDHSHGAAAVSVTCYVCVHFHRITDSVFGLDGPSFRAYYCSTRTTRPGHACSVANRAVTRAAFKGNSMRERVVTHYNVERTFVDGDVTAYFNFDLVVIGTFSYARFTRDEPEEADLELDSVTCNGEPFELTSKEETELLNWWKEELTS